MFQVCGEGHEVPLIPHGYHTIFLVGLKGAFWLKFYAKMWQINQQAEILVHHCLYIFTTEAVVPTQKTCYDVEKGGVQMDHREYIRQVDGSRTAVLMLHGIAGTPAHFRDLIPVIPESFSVYNLMLDGHGKTVKDFSATSMKRWKAQAACALDRLAERYDNIYIVAHSMGTLFAIRGAVERPEKVAGLFLLAVPTRPWVRLSTVMTALRVLRGNIDPADTAAVNMQNDTCIQLEKRLLSYVGWVPRLMELLAEIPRVRKLLPRLTVPTVCFQSHTDELVSRRSCRDLERHPCITLTELQSSGHFAYDPQEVPLLQESLKAMLYGSRSA